MEETQKLGLGAYLAILSRRWLVVAVGAGLVVGAVLAITATQAPKYRAKVDVQLQYEQAASLISDTRAASIGTEDRARALRNEIDYLSSGAMLDRLYAQLGYRPQVDVTETDGRDKITFSAVGLDPDQTAAAVNTYVDLYLESRTQRLADSYKQAADGLDQLIAKSDERIREVNAAIAANPPTAPAGPAGATATSAQATQAQADELRALQSRRDLYVEQRDLLALSGDISRQAGATVLGRAVPPPEPFAPRPMRLLILGVMGGLFLGCCAALVIDRLDDRVRSVEALEKSQLGVPILGVIPVSSGPVGWAGIRHMHTGQQAEAFRSLRTAVLFSSQRQEVRSLLITSPKSDEGKTSVVTGLATVMAQAGRDVLCIDGDLRRHELHSRLGVSNRRGLSDVLAGDVELTNAIAAVPDSPGMFLLSAGSGTFNPGDLFTAPSNAGGSLTFAQVVEATVSAGFFVIVDSPALLSVSDAVAASTSVDATMIVLAAKSTRLKRLRRAITELTAVDARVIGVVVNRAKAERRLHHVGRPQRAPRPTPLLQRDVEASVPTAAPQEPDAFRRRRTAGTSQPLNGATPASDASQPAHESNLVIDLDELHARSTPLDLPPQRFAEAPTAPTPAPSTAPTPTPAPAPRNANRTSAPRPPARRRPKAASPEPKGEVEHAAPSEADHVLPLDEPPSGSFFDRASQRPDTGAQWPTSSDGAPKADAGRRPPPANSINDQEASDWPRDAEERDGPQEAAPAGAKTRRATTPARKVRRSPLSPAEKPEEQPAARDLSS